MSPLKVPLSKCSVMTIEHRECVLSAVMLAEHVVMLAERVVMGPRQCIRVERVSACIMDRFIFTQSGTRNDVISKWNVVDSLSSGFTMPTELRPNVDRLAFITVRNALNLASGPYIVHTPFPA